MTSKTAVIRYRYAQCRDATIVDINKIDSETRYELAPYYCLGCGGELIPNLGQKKAKHFSHKVTCDCSRESYLHKLAKEEFRETYSRCLIHKLPFTFETSFPATCNFYETEFGGTCEVETKRKVNLTKHFKHIEIEKQFQGFTPDILLSNEDRSEVLFVEIAVTHQCEADKINLGNRIIEIDIANEDDVSLIQSAHLDSSSSNVKTYNFKKREITDDVCKGQCFYTVKLFVIYESKESILLELSPAEAKSLSRHPKVKHHEFLGFSYEDSDSPEEIYRNKVRTAHFAGIPIRNCCLCRYHGSGGWDWIFCKFLKKSVGTNEAVNCKYYRVFKNTDECEKADKANDEYLRKTEIRVTDEISIPIFHRQGGKS